MNPTIQVTINPDGTAKEVNPVQKPHKALPDRDWAYARLEWLAAEAKLRTFDIQYPKCICKTVKQMEDCPKECEPYRIEAGETHTAEILETYTEPREGGIAGRVRIIS